MATAVASELNGQMYIDGAWCDARDGRKLEVINPADEGVVAEVAYGGRADAERAIEAAAKAFPAWRATSVYDRAKILKKTADLMRDRADAIARTLTSEQGKPLMEATDGGPARGRHVRVVRRGGEARLRPDHPRLERRQAALRDLAPGRRGRHDHALEFPGRPAQPQDRAGAGGRLHGGQPTGRPDAAHADPDVRVPGRRGPAPGRRQPRHRRGRTVRRRPVRAPRGAEDQLHRLDPRRQGADRPLGRPGQAAEPRAAAATLR